MNVCFYENCPVNVVYKAILVKGVEKIIRCIGDDFSSVKWMIYDGKNPPNLSRYSEREDILGQLYKKVGFPILHIPRDGKEFGFCSISDKTIYISLQTIQSYREPMLPLALQLNPNRELSLFTRVVIDELAHITTGKDHGNPLYDTTLALYKQRCRGL